MDIASLISELKGSLFDLSELFEKQPGFSFTELINAAVADLHRVKPFRRQGSINLVAGILEYTAPTDYLSFGSSTWGDDQRRLANPWETDYPTVLPTVSAMDVAGTKKLFLSFAPSANDISVLGATYNFSYFARYLSIDDVPDENRTAVLLRARAECYLGLDARAADRPANTSLPGAAKTIDLLSRYKELMKQFEAQAA